MSECKNAKTAMPVSAKLERLANELNARTKDMRKARNRKRYTLNPPANAAIDLEKAKRNHFAQGITVYSSILPFRPSGICQAPAVLKFYAKMNRRITAGIYPASPTYTIQFAL